MRFLTLEKFGEVEVEVQNVKIWIDSQMIDKTSQTQAVHVLFIYSLKADYMFRPSSLGHHQAISLYPGNCTIYDRVCEIKSLLFNEVSFFVYKILI